MVLASSTSMLFYSSDPVVDSPVFVAKKKNYQVEISRDFRPQRREREQGRERMIFVRADLKEENAKKLISSQDKEKEKPKARLLGILYGAQKAAVFEVAGKARSLETGDTLEGWKIDRIEAEAVHLSYLTRLHTIEFDSSVFEKGNSSSRRNSLSRRNNRFSNSPPGYPGP